MTKATLATLMMYLVTGSVQAERAPKSQSMADFLSTQSFYPPSWAQFASSGEPDVFDDEFGSNATRSSRSKAALMSIKSVHSASWAISLADNLKKLTRAKPHSHRTSLASIYQSMSSSQPASLAFVMSTRDPADDLADKLVAKSGLNNDEEVKHRTIRASPMFATNPKRFNLQPVDVLGTAPVTAADNIQQFNLQKEAKSTHEASSWESSVGHRASAAMKNMYHDWGDLVSEPYRVISEPYEPYEHHVDDVGQRDEPIESGASELNHGISASSPVKVLHQAAAFRKPRGLEHLGKTVQKYSEDEESPIDASSLPNSYLHHGSTAHGKKRAPEEEQKADHLKVNPEDMVTRIPPPAESSASLARSLRSSMEADKMQEMRAHVVEKSELDAVKSEDNMIKALIHKKGPVKSEEKEELSKNSAISSVHRSKFSKLKFKVLPEDVHHEEPTTGMEPTTGKEPTTGNVKGFWKIQNGKRQLNYGNEPTTGKEPTTGNTTTGNLHPQSVNSTEPTTGNFAHEPIVHSTESSQTNEWDFQFNANAVDGHLDSQGIEKVLSAMTKMKDPESWNWKLFDLDGDGKLSRSEFMNAKQVLLRFKDKK